MGRETGSLQLLAPLLLTGGKGADLVICGNIVLNTLYLDVAAARSNLHQLFVTPAGPWPSRTVLRDSLRFSLYAIEWYVFLIRWCDLCGTNCTVSIRP
jgi:hypothetical protein